MRIVIRNTHQNKHILLAFAYNNRPDRERLSGILRFTTLRPKWEIRILDRSSSSVNHDAKLLTSTWRIDAVICTADSNYLNVLGLSGNRSPIFVAMDPPEGSEPQNANVIVKGRTSDITERVAALMLQRGYKNFAFYGTRTPEEIAYSNACERHFLHSLKRQNRQCLVFSPSHVSSWSERLKATSAWLQSLPKPCAVLAYSDELAKGLLDACRIAHIDVPGQVSIIGVDDSPEICETCRPTLTSVRLDFELSGYLAAKTLDSVFQRGSLWKRRTVRYGISGITERASTQDFRGRGRIVSMATDILRTLPLESLNVDTISRKTNTSRRLLEMYFKQILGHSMREEIACRRLKAIRERLVKTSAPIGDIVLACGFRTLSAAQVAFRKRYGISMNALRKCLPSAKASQGL